MTDIARARCPGTSRSCRSEALAKRIAGLGTKVDHIWTKATAKDAFIYTSPRSSAMVKNGSHYYAYSLLHTF